MPIYAYRCTTCGHAKDVLQKMSDPLLTLCPDCGASTFVKQVTAAGFQLKGSGWYVTDFKGGDKPAAKPDANGADGAKGDAAKGDAAKTGTANGTAANGEPAKGGAGAADSAGATQKKGDAAPAAAPAPSPAAAPPASGAK
jgi:putative FmdB family regulatory protein